MSTEANKAIIQRVMAALNVRNWEALREVMTPELITALQTDPFYAAFPDVQIITEEMLADGDKVVTRWTDQGTHTEPFLGIAPTGRRISVSGINIDRIEHGKIVEAWVHWDELGLLRQLGISSIPS